MTLSDLSIKNSVFAVMLAAAMIVFGYLGYKDLGVSQFPEIDFPVVSIAIRNEGARPDNIDSDVTEFVEDAVAGVEGVDYIMSQSLENTSLVTVYFHLHRDIDVAMQDVQNAVSAARRRLPFEIDPPVISKVNPNNLPVLWLTLSGPLRLNEISDFAEKQFKQHVQAIPGVAGVQFGGLQSRNLRVWLDAKKLRTFNLTSDDVVQAIQRQHAELPAGVIKSDLIEFNLRTMGEAYSVNDFRNLVVAQRNGQQIKLHQVADVEDGLEDRRSLARYNRMPAVAIGVRKAIGGNLVAVCENVKNELPRLRKLLPKGMELHVPVDYSVFVRENVDELQLTLFLGIVLTAGVCFLFLGSLGTTINICLSIPTSLIGTFFVVNYGLKLFGMEPFTINLMTLLALSLSVGVVVDDAILVLENIYRHRQQGADKKTAATYGAREITFAAAAATFSIMAIFLPVAFMTGTIGKFFFQFGVTVSVAVFLSLISALTLTPMLCAFFLNLHEKWPRRPVPFGMPLGVFVGGLVVLIGATFRVLEIWVPEMEGWGWPLNGCAKPQAAGAELAGWWVLESGVEFAAGLLLTCYGGLMYWTVNRFFLTPVFIQPVEWAMQRMTTGYGRLLAWSLRHWGLVLIAGAALIGVAFYFLYYDVLGQELVPVEDQSRFVIHVTTPVGSSINQVDELLQECEEKLSQRDDIEGFLTTVATEPGQLMNQADIFVQLKPHGERTLRQHQIMSQVRRELATVGDIRVAVRDQSMEGFTAQRGHPVDFVIQGDWDQLPGYATKIQNEMAASGKFQDIDTDHHTGMPEVRLYPLRDKLALVDVPIKHLADSMNAYVGGARVAKYTDRGRRYDVRVRLKAPQRDTPDDLKSLPLRAGPNRLVTLYDVTYSVTESTEPVINRYNHGRKIQITAAPGPGVSQGEAIAEAQKIARDVLPPDFDVVELGNARAMQETMESLIFALVLGIIIAYMILGVQFNSFVHPFTVLLAMPFAVTGALVTLWLTGDTLNMMSMIGLILLMGLVKKNSIILVDYTNQLRGQRSEVRGQKSEVRSQESENGGEGAGDGQAGLTPDSCPLTPEQAVVKACPVRLRPILMTSVATVAGAIPAALGLGPGAETRAPMARGIIGGIVLSTLVTLVLVPVFYVLLERLRGAVGRLVVAPKEAERISERQA